MELLINLVSGLAGGGVMGKLLKGRGLVSMVLGLLGGGVGHFFNGNILELLGGLSNLGEGGPAAVSGGLGGILSVVGSLFGRKQTTEE